jgi:D-glycero-alpha-D-manno-heptose-7-phosphate kinase
MVPEMGPPETTSRQSPLADDPLCRGYPLGLRARTEPCRCPRDAFPGRRIATAPTTVSSISRTPYRMSFFGGGTDYPTWFRENGGAVLAATINRFCYINCRYLPPFFRHKTGDVWSQIENVADNWPIKRSVIPAVLEWLGFEGGVEIHHNGDLPARSGLGSSSAFTVGLLHALHAVRGQMVSKREVAAQAIHVEQHLLAEAVGVQDQIETAYGGLNLIKISPDGAFHVSPVMISDERLRSLQDHLMLFYTGVARASTVAADQIAAIPYKQRELTAMRQMVDESLAILTSERELGDFGRLLHEAWKIKRTLSATVAPPFIDEIYDRARRAGAIGGKLLGAGGGGFMLLFAAPDRRQAVLDALAGLLIVPIAFERNGTQLILCDPEQYSPASHTRPDLVASSDDLAR